MMTNFEIIIKKCLIYSLVSHEHIIIDVLSVQSAVFKGKKAYFYKCFFEISINVNKNDI